MIKTRIMEKSEIESVTVRVQVSGQEKEITVSGHKYEIASTPTSSTSATASNATPKDFPWNGDLGARTGSDLSVPVPSLKLNGTTISGKVKYQIHKDASFVKAHAFYDDSHTDTLFMLICYKGVVKGSDWHELKVDITDTSLSNIKYVKAYLFKDDPLTSRGTKTSVQSSKLDPDDKKIGTMDMS